MRVLFITGEFPPMQGGVGDCTNEIAKGLTRLGVDVQVLTTAGSATLAVVESDPNSGSSHPNQAPERENGVRVHRLVKKWDWSSLRPVTAAVRCLAPAVVHIQYQTGAYGMHPAINFLPRRFRPRPGDVGLSPRGGVTPRPHVITTFHDLLVPYLFPKAGPVRDWVTRLLARSSDAVIATNDEDYLSLQSWRLPDLSLIPIGSNIPSAPPPGFSRGEWRARLGVADGETLLCYFGFLNPSKGAETLIRATAQVPRTKLLMIGGQVGASDPNNLAYLAKVRKWIDELGLAQRVVWTDYTSAAEVSANFLASDICVMPYRDGASYRRGSFMAALAHGMAIVTTFPPAMSPHAPMGSPHKLREASLPPLRDGANVVLVPPDDVHALAAAISRLAGSPELRAGLSRGARELAAFFDWDKIARQHLELYEHLMGSGHAVPIKPQRA